MHVRTGRQAHEISILIASIVVGSIGAVIPHRVSNAVAFELHGWLIHAYYIGLVVFPLITLFGIFSKKIDGLLVERIGLTVVGIYYGVFAACIFAYTGLGGVMGALLPIAYTVANFARVRQIGTDLALLKSYLADHPDEPFVR